MGAATAELLEWQVVISAGMGEQLHWFPEDVSPERLASVLVGMANTSGGRVYLGAAPRSGHLIGLHDPAAALDKVFQAVLLSEPALVLPVPERQSFGDKEVLLIHVPRGLPHVYSLEARYLGREGAQTNPIPARQLRSLLLERGGVQFDSSVPQGSTWDDLDEQKISAYLELLDMPGGESPQVILGRRGCVNANACPTIAGLLLFGRYPQQWLPNATILAVRFSGASLSDQFIRLDATGSLPEQLRQVEAFVRQNLPSLVQMNGLTHATTLAYPLEAVRELLVNAIAHRDYAVYGDNIHLNIYSNRIEIQSPGSLPGPVNLDNLLDARFSRNAVIVQALADMGFIERLGYGLDRVVRLMLAAGLRPPRFEEIAGTFRVTLYNENLLPAGRTLDNPRFIDLEINPRQEIALIYLDSHRRISNRDFQDLCPEVHPETLRRDLADLVGRGLLIKVGDKRATYYIISKSHF